MMVEAATIGLTDHTETESPIVGYRRRLERAALEGLEASAGSFSGHRSPTGGRPDSQRCVLDAANAELLAIDQERLIDGLAALHPTARERLLRGVLGSTLGLGPLHEILDDSSVEEVLGRWDYLTVHRSGRDPEVLRGSASPWDSEQHLVDWLSYAARTQGLAERSFNPGSPLLVMRLGPGLRLAAQRDVGAHVTFALRRNVLGRVTLGDLVGREMMLPIAAELLAAIMALGEARLVFSGATGAGKTTLARACLAQLHPSAHVIVMEDTAEIDLFDPDRHPNVESWEVREPNAENRGGVDLARLVRHSLRHRPDWNVVGEVRDGEAATPMVAAMTAGVASLTTVHARSAAGALDKLQLYLGMGAEPLAAETARLQLSLAVDFIVQVERDHRTGRRFIGEIVQVVGHDGHGCQTNAIYRERAGRRAVANVLTEDMARRLADLGFDTRRLAASASGVGS